MIVECTGCNNRFEAAGYRDATCTGCGAIAHPPAPLPCPGCDLLLQARHVSDVLVDDCVHCGGLFIDHVGIQRLVTEHHPERAAAVLAALRPSDASAPTSLEASYRCPRCGATMARKLSETGAGIVIDVCRSHGVFLERGELAGLLRFLQREAERKQREHADPRTHYADVSALLGLLFRDKER